MEYNTSMNGAGEEVATPDLVGRVRAIEAADRKHKALVSDLVKSVLRANTMELPKDVREARAKLILECGKLVVESS